MKKFWLILGGISVFTLVICGGGFVYASNLKPVEPPKIDQPLNATIVFNLVNKERIKAGLKPLVRDAQLDATAQDKADEMVRLNYFGHFNPQTGNNTAWDNPIFKQICTASSENISRMDDPNGDNNQDAVSGWMNSKPHHDAILDSRYTLTGVAINGDKVVQHFCISK